MREPKNETLGSYLSRGVSGWIGGGDADFAFGSDGIVIGPGRPFCATRRTSASAPVLMDGAEAAWRPRARAAHLCVPERQPSPSLVQLFRLAIVADFPRRRRRRRSVNPEGDFCDPVFVFDRVPSKDGAVSERCPL